MTLSPEIRDFYTRPGFMTATAAHADQVAALPRDVTGVSRTIQGFFMHEHWAQAYGQTLTPERHAQSHLRTTGAMLDAVLAQGPGLAERPFDVKTVGICRHFSVLAVAMLRAKGTPARARCGFGAYFNKGTFEDHWVVEYHDGTRWKLADSQIDTMQKNALHIGFDLYDVPRDQFVIAFDAWKRYREGRDDPMRYGIFKMRGAWFIAGNVMRDAAALNNMEMLPWDVWGGMADEKTPMTGDQLAFTDHLADLTSDPDANFEALRTIYQDPRLKVPPAVFNALTQKMETV
jgi:hypothetical protein